jgi:hypothetical protein
MAPFDKLKAGEESALSEPAPASEWEMISDHC